MNVSVAFHNAGLHTIWGKLAAKLGRDPTDAEVKADISRILSDVSVAQAEQGKMPHQRRA